MVVIRQNQRKVVSLDQTAAMPIDIHDIVDGFFGSLHVHSPNTRFYTINCQFVNCFLLQTNSFLLFLQHQCHGTGFRTKLHHLFAIITSTASLVWTGTDVVKCHLSTARALAAALTRRLSAHSHCGQPSRSHVHYDRLSRCCWLRSAQGQKGRITAHEDCD